VFERLLDNTDIESSELAAFKAKGEFDSEIAPAHERDEVICHCSRVTAGDLVSLISAGCNTLEKVAAKSMATRVCGGCIPSVNEFLGKGEWIPVVCDGAQTHAPDIRMFRLRVLQGEAKPFLPGQHLVLQARIGGRWIGRPYTISSGPGAAAHYEITVKREEKGLLSRWLFESLDPGSALRISLPRGSYYLASENASNIVFLAGGIGITPGLAMARSYCAAPRAWRFHLDHSVRLEEQAVNLEELRRLTSSCPGMSYTVRVTRWDRRLGLSDIQELERTHPAARYYLCGSPRYVAGLEALLTHAGIAKERIETEQFSPVG
jgi:nitric-oxide synthase